MTKHSGTGSPKPQWWKHLREYKRVFWKRDRKLLKFQSDQWTRRMRSPDDEGYWSHLARLESERYVKRGNED